jgi:hypothetical protein
MSLRAGFYQATFRSKGILSLLPRIVPVRLRRWPPQGGMPGVAPEGSIAILLQNPVAA